MGSDNIGFWWRPFLGLRFWPTWLMFGFLRVMTLLPFPWQMRVGSLIGALAMRLAATRRHVASVNLRLCFPEASAVERERLLKAHFDALGKGVVETALCWWGRSFRLRDKVCLVGLEHLQRARAHGRGVILLSAHFTSLELGGRLLALHVPFHVLYRRHKNPLFEAVMRRARQRRFDQAIPREDTRALLASLKAGVPVWYAPDQHHAGPQSRFVPFFGVQASTLTATSRLARLSGAPVVPFFQARLPGKAGYLLVLCPALDHFPGDDIEQDTSRINRLIEGVIREIPEQYLWVHRRFKSRPPGETCPY
jgi:KDO2-lipid IV(A) lauroyltransferase